MSTNPNNAIGTNGAYGGRTSVDAFNDNLAIYQGRGILSGFAVSPNAGMTVAIGGNGTNRDVAIAEDNIGNKTTINNRTGSPVVMTIAGAPAANSRIDAIVAYVDNPAQGVATVTDNPGACGLIDVQGTVASSPSKPTEANIRSAITADGASGSTAYYVVLGYVRIASGTTDITSNMISAGDSALANGKNILAGIVAKISLSNQNGSPDTVYTADFDGFISARVNFSAANGYAVFQVFQSDGTTRAFDIQINCGPQQAYSNPSPYLPIAKGMKYSCTSGINISSVQFRLAKM